MWGRYIISQLVGRRRRTLAAQRREFFEPSSKRTETRHPGSSSACARPLAFVVAVAVAAEAAAVPGVGDTTTRALNFGDDPFGNQ